MNTSDVVDLENAQKLSDNHSMIIVKQSVSKSSESHR